ncbi:hypothetical protein CVT26_013241 [Gymnopilus dilepis]|uniref:Uncharacterized protein n=1 Tax=Gymnopilus dilepis TaxID=231916 RepID=A0A409WDD8_9AGAR|nr:hypothetical protein CVT26_013241 [Gymnopilus dilepis]
MISTSLLLSIQMRWVKRWPIVVGIAYFAIFGFFDALFWGASLKKVPHGAWVPLLIGVVLESIMVLWVWAKTLEDNFDGKNRRNLNHFIYMSRRPSSPKPRDHEESDEQETGEEDEEKSYYFYDARNMGVSDDSMKEKIGEKRELQRIPSAAVFHKIASGRGVPHTFIGFIRQWPALPRVVIFLSVCVVPIARVPAQDRYVLTKVRTIDGFYGCTYYIGFRDKFDVRIDDLVDKICSLECHLNPAVSDAYIEEIRDVCRKATHVAPHYHVVAKKIEAGIGTPLVNYLRTILIESIYRRLATMFPETANWLTSADEIIHVGINAII